MFLLDSLLVNGLRFVLDKVALAADSERDDDTSLRESLLEAQSRLETGEITEAEYVVLEREVLQALSEIRRRRQGADGAPVVGAYKVTGADVRVRGETDD